MSEEIEKKTKKIKKVKEEIVEIEGIKCKVKNAKKKALAIHYQEYVRQALSDYISKEIMNPTKQNYADGLQLNIRIAPFSFGWLHWPENENDKRVIKGLEPIKKISKKKVKK